MKRELPSPQRRSHDSPQRASPPARRRTCGPSEGPKLPHAEQTKMGPDLQLHRRYIYIIRSEWNLIWGENGFNRSDFQQIKFYIFFLSFCTKIYICNSKTL